MPPCYRAAVLEQFDVDFGCSESYAGGRFDDALVDLVADAFQVRQRRRCRNIARGCSYADFKFITIIFWQTFSPAYHLIV